LWAAAELDELIEQDQPLIIEHEAHPVGQILPHLLPFWARLARPREQSDHFILRYRRLARRDPYEFSERTSAGFKELTGRLDRAEGTEKLHPGIVHVGIRDLPL